MARATKRPKNILVVDIGGTNVKVFATGQTTPIKFPSGRRLTPARMVATVKKLTVDWEYDAVSIGFPGPVVRDRPTREPWNLGRGWLGFSFRRAFGKPVRVINDAAMQALGSYSGKSMLFLGLGTGLGSTLIRDGLTVPMELAHLPYRNGRTYEEYLGEGGYGRLGKQRWRQHVARVVALFIAAFEVDYVVLGGGNARRLRELPPKTRLGDNANAFKGGFRMWDAPKGRSR